MSGSRRRVARAAGRVCGVSCRTPTSRPDTPGYTHDQLASRFSVAFDTITNLIPTIVTHRERSKSPDDSLGKRLREQFNTLRSVARADLSGSLMPAFENELRAVESAAFGVLEAPPQEFLERTPSGLRRVELPSWNGFAARAQAGLEQLRAYWLPMIGTPARDRGTVGKGQSENETGEKTNGQVKRKGNRTHAESKDPQRKYKANLYKLIQTAKKEGEGDEALATRLNQRRDLVELAQQAGLEGITENVVKAALQAKRYTPRRK